MIKTTLGTAICGLWLSGMVSADVPQVTTDIPVTHSLVTRVMAGIGTPDLIVNRGASPHDYSLRPSNAASLEAADLVFWISSELTPWLEGALKTLAADAKVIELMDAKGSTVLPFREGSTFETHSHRHKHDEDEHATVNVDPHGWLDPYNGKTWLDVIATELSKIDPENTDIYFDNVSQGKTDIDAVISEIDATLAPFRGTNFIVYHDAYQYFERRFDVLAAGSISMGDVSDPSPARIAEIHQTVEELDMTCVFSEPQFNPELVATVVDGTKARARVIDPLGTRLTLGADFYLNLLRNIAQTMASCL
ncbi:MAG: zinc ABC transporter substrate-binding protein [Arenicellales bacterium]|jgi:zinc transport system substrate-binding protein|nr:zinc ABC transporter substrate-binding protein [Arenicellales bacterium]|tara:strand:+ start:200 stop:1120 length:921 start_codon:yes stop_codon:yes gene_type:complete